LFRIAVRNLVLPIGEWFLFFWRHWVVAEEAHYFDVREWNQPFQHRAALPTDWRYHLYFHLCSIIAFAAQNVVVPQMMSKLGQWVVTQTQAVGATRPTTTKVGIDIKKMMRHIS